MAARPRPPATMAGKVVFWIPTMAPTSWTFVQLRPWSSETATAGFLSPSANPRYTRPAVSTATDGSLPPVPAVPGTVRTSQVRPLSSETATPFSLGFTVPVQEALGT